MLAFPNFDIPFTVESDASGSVMGVVLAQNGHPITFFRKAFSPKLLCASMYVWELCAIMITVKKWHQYLLGRRFTILTDPCSLKELLTPVIQTFEQHIYLVRLMGFDYDPISLRFQ